MLYVKPQKAFWKLKVISFSTALTLGIVSTQTMAADVASGRSDLDVKITGIKKQQGSVRVAVFSSKETWLKKPVFTAILKANAPELNFSKQQVPYGDYGIAIFHDRNDNGEMDRNFIGLPKEPYGFSNNARGSFGPAKWKKSKVTVSAPTTNLGIKIK